jgi:putative ABC transport system permease protein
VLSDLLLRLRAVFRRTVVDREIDEELRFHLDRQIESYKKAGLDDAEAARRARLEFGGIDQIREEYRDALGVRILDHLWRDLRLAVRSLAGTPVVSMVAGLSLALGIGANTAIFSLIDGLMLRRLPGVAEPERLVTMSSGRTNDTGMSNAADPRWSYVFWKEIEKRSQAFGGALAWSASRFDVSTGGETLPVEGIFVSGDFFKTLGVPAIIGRTFTAEDDVGGGGPGGPAAVISYNLWQRRFAGSPQVLGTSLTIERAPFTVVGVTPAGFFGTEVGRAFDVAVPLGAEALIRGSQSFLKPPFDRFNYWLVVALRLKAEQSLEAATAVLRGMQPQIREGAQPQIERARVFEFLKEPFTLTPIGTGTSQLRRVYRRPLLAILFVVALVLLVACANIANLQLARATARRHELSLRRALGAPPWQLVRQLFIESLVLASLGASAALLIASWGSRVLVAQISTPASPITLDLSLDWRVLGFTMAITVATAVVFGIAPALQAARVAPIEAIKTQGRGGVGEGRTGASGLVVLQAGLALVLVVFAGLFVGTFQRLATRPLGFDSNRVLLARVNIAHARVEPSERGSFYHRLVAAVASVPGVAQAAGSTSTPVDRSNFSAFVHVTGMRREPASERISSKYNFVTPRWFSAYGISLRAGRDFDAHDARGGRPVVIVNDAFVRRFFPGGNPVSSTIGLTAGPREEYSFGTKTIVGVVGDAVYSSPREAPQPTMYFPLAQWDLPVPLSASINISIRSSAGSPAVLVSSVNAALAAVEKTLAAGFQTLDMQVKDSLRTERIVAILSGSFAGLALLLAGLGIYGVTAYAVARRRTEIGIRIALGAVPHAVVRLVLLRVLILVLLGAVIGSTFSVWASRFAAALLYGIEPRDPMTLIGAVAILTAVAACAGWVPARRAACVDPAEVLREG